MQPVKVLIVEDDLLIATALKAMLAELDYEVPAIYRSGKSLLQNYFEGCADMIIMDINLADDISGVEASKIIARNSSIPIIYLTQNDDTATRKQAIAETNATYYLSKPFNISDVVAAIELTLKFIKTQNFKKPVAPENSFVLDDSIFVKADLSYKKLSLNDVVLLKADGSYTHLMAKEKTFVFSENLSFFDDKLMFAKNFIRVHRSYIINSNYVERIFDKRIFVSGHEVPIGKTYRSKLLEKFRFI